MWSPSGLNRITWLILHSRPSVSCTMGRRSSTNMSDGTSSDIMWSGSWTYRKYNRIISESIKTVIAWFKIGIKVESRREEGGFVYWGGFQVSKFVNQSLETARFPFETVNETPPFVQKISKPSCCEKSEKGPLQQVFKKNFEWFIISCIGTLCIWVSEKESHNKGKKRKNVCWMKELHCNWRSLDNY